MFYPLSHRPIPPAWVWTCLPLPNSTYVTTICHEQSSHNTWVLLTALSPTPLPHPPERDHQYTLDLTAIQKGLDSSHDVPS